MYVPFCSSISKHKCTRTEHTGWALSLPGPRGTISSRNRSGAPRRHQVTPLRGLTLTKSCSRSPVLLFCRSQTHACTTEAVLSKTELKLFLLLFYKKESAILKSILRRRPSPPGSSQFAKAFKILNFDQVLPALSASTGTAALCHTIHSSFQSYVYTSKNMPYLTPLGQTFHSARVCVCLHSQSIAQNSI